MAEGDELSGGLGDLYAPLLPGAAGHRHHSLPFPYLIDRPCSRLALVKSIGILSIRVQEDGFCETFIEDSVQQTVSRDASPLQRNVRQKCKDLIGALKCNLFHRHGFAL